MYNTHSSSFAAGISFAGGGDPSQAFSGHSNGYAVGGDSSVFRTLASASFHSQCDGFLGEFSSHPMAFYDPSMNMNLPSCLHDHDYGFFSGMEAGIGSRRRKAAASSGGLEDCGTQKNEKQRRERLGMKFELLKSLIPNPTKPDRATIISDAINYIKELLKTLNELKLRAGKKGGRNYRAVRIEEDEFHRDMESPSIKSIVDEESDHGQIGITKSSWIQRRTPSTFVDVRTIEDEVYIKLQQIKRVDCALIVSRVLDELQLEMIHFSGGNIGNCSVFMISSKVNERSLVYASSVARRFIEAMDG